MGSFLYGKSIAAWLSVIERLKTAPASYILKNLQVPDLKKIKPPTLQSKGLNEVGSLEITKADDVDGVKATEINKGSPGGDEISPDTQKKDQLGDVTKPEESEDLDPADNNTTVESYPKGTIGIQRQESLPEQPDGIWSSAKSFLSEVFTAEWMFLIVSLMLEIFSAICDQLSSPRKPLYALFGMGLAIMALATCIWEFIHKGRGKVQFGKCGKFLWWFYCPCSGTLFGTFPEVCGLIYAITQWASSMVQLACVLRHKDNPFKVNILPVLFLVCLVVSKLIRNARGSTTSETKLEAIAVDP
ncbi:hypothetical protein ACE6H2_027273 [Prunus campanulata]